ncbi:hypothetical protein AYI70_g200 [Smittium culicis]|uniref:Uncharacterized protein n=1 Tax=Smittium culicis TaxID=133412 RepID=A0A1R1YHM4_9FUNG|nr:hypothetical protein AYI70_g200 [Smittium culicis]
MINRASKLIEKYEDTYSTAPSSIFQDPNFDSQFSDIDYETYKRLYNSLFSPDTKESKKNQDSSSKDSFNTSPSSDNIIDESSIDDRIRTLLYFKQLLNLPLSFLNQEPDMITSEINRIQDDLLNHLYKQPDSALLSLPKDSNSQLKQSSPTSNSIDATDSKHSSKILSGEFDPNSIFLEISNTYEFIISSTKEIETQTSHIDSNISNISQKISKANKLVSDLEKSRELSKKFNSQYDIILQMVELPKLFRQYVNSSRHTEAIELYQNITRFANEFKRNNGLQTFNTIAHTLNSNPDLFISFDSYNQTNFDSLLIPTISTSSTNDTNQNNYSPSDSKSSLAVNRLVDNIVSKVRSEFYSLVNQTISDLYSSISSLHKPARLAYLSYSPSISSKSIKDKNPQASKLSSSSTIQMQETVSGVSKSAQRLASIVNYISILKQTNVFSSSTNNHQLEMLYCQIQWNVFLSLASSFGINIDLVSSSLKNPNPISIYHSPRNFIDSPGFNPLAKRKSLFDMYNLKNSSIGLGIDQNRRNDISSPISSSLVNSFKPSPTLSPFILGRKTSSLFNDSSPKSSGLYSSPVNQSPSGLNSPINHNNKSLYSASFFNGNSNNILEHLCTFSSSFVDWIIDLYTQYSYLFSNYSDDKAEIIDSEINVLGNSTKSHILNSLISRASELMILFIRSSLGSYCAFNSISSSNSNDYNKALFNVIDQFGWLSEKLATHGLDFINSSIMPTLIEMLIAYICGGIRVPSSSISSDLQEILNHINIELAETLEISGDKNSTSSGAIANTNKAASISNGTNDTIDKKMNDFALQTFWTKLKSPGKFKLANIPASVFEKINSRLVDPTSCDNNQFWKELVLGHRISGIDILQYPPVASLYHSFRKTSLSITSLLKSDPVQKSELSKKFEVFMDLKSDNKSEVLDDEESSGISSKQIEIMNVLTCCFEHDLAKISAEIRDCFTGLDSLIQSIEKIDTGSRPSSQDQNNLISESNPIIAGNSSITKLLDLKRFLSEFSVVYLFGLVRYICDFYIDNLINGLFSDLGALDPSAELEKRGFIGIDLSSIVDDLLPLLAFYYTNY